MTNNEDFGKDLYKYRKDQCITKPKECASELAIKDCDETIIGHSNEDRLKCYRGVKKGLAEDN